jgi:uncharacterized protein YegJ (DUF2314 family)
MGMSIMFSLKSRLIVGLFMILVGSIGKYMSHGSSAGASLSHPQDSVVRVRTTDADIVAAKAKAQAGLDRFFGRLKNPAANESSFGLKFNLNHGHPERGEAEIIWARDIQVAGNGDIAGFLDNDPITPGFKSGDLVYIQRAAIADWAIRVGDRFEGHYTTRVLVATMPPADAAQVMARLVPE